MSKTFLTCGSEFSTKLSKLVSTCSDDHFDEKKTFLKIDFFFEIWANFFPTFGKKYFANLAELLSKRSDEQYDVQPTTSLKSSSYLFGFWPKLFLKFRILFFAKVWKLFSKNWYEHFNQKKSFLKSSLQSFSESDRNIFWLLAKNPRRDCQICFLRLQKYFEETDFFNFVFFSLCNRTLSKTFLTCGSEFSTKLSKLLPTCSDDNFDEKKNIFKKLIFFFEIWANFFPTFGKKYSATLAEVLSKRSDEHFDVQQPLLKNILLFWILVETFSEISKFLFCKSVKSVF